jgi:hypothetical protein
MWSALWRNVELTLLGISVISSQDLIYFASLLVPVEAALLIMGAALLLRDWRHPGAFLMLLSGLGALVVGGALLKNAPSLSRLTGAFPVFCAAVAIPIGAWVDQARERLPSSRKWIASAILAVVLVSLSSWNVRFYFHDYYANPDVIIDPRYKAAQQRYEIQTALARYLSGVGPDYAVRVVANTTVPFDRDLEKYLGGTQDYANIADPHGSLLPESQPGKGMAFVFFAGSERFRAVIESRYPGGVTQEVASRGGKHLFYVYVLPPAGYTNKEG